MSLNTIFQAAFGLDLKWIDWQFDAKKNCQCLFPCLFSRRSLRLADLRFWPFGSGGFFMNFM